MRQKRVVRDSFSMVLLRAAWAGPVMESASSRMMILKGGHLFPLEHKTVHHVHKYTQQVKYTHTRSHTVNPFPNPGFDVFHSFVPNHVHLTVALNYRKIMPLHPLVQISWCLSVNLLTLCVFQPRWAVQSSWPCGGPPGCHAHLRHSAPTPSVCTAGDYKTKKGKNG